MKTIKSSDEISRIFKTGRRYSTPHISLLVTRTAQQHDLTGRVAFVAGKKLGGAVWRNRAKRRMRGICADLGGPFAGWDVIFIARKGVGEAPYSTMRKNVAKALAKARITDASHV